MITFDTVITALVTQYDVKQAKSKYYNVYALSHYLAACKEFNQDVSNGNAWQTRINRYFNGSLLNHVSKGIIKWETTGKYPMPTK